VSNVQPASIEQLKTERVVCTATLYIWAIGRTRPVIDETGSCGHPGHVISVRFWTNERCVPKSWQCLNTSPDCILIRNI